MAPDVLLVIVLPVECGQGHERDGMSEDRLTGMDIR
jgi:hypothetical protein